MSDVQPGLTIIEGSAGAFVDGSATKARTFRPQVCIVGSGAGGAVAAAQLAAAGFEVLVVEEGGHHTKTEFRMNEDAAYPMLYQEDAGRATKDLAISILQGRSVGGSTTVNWTTCFRTPDHVVDHWARVHNVKGFSYADLVPHWEAVEHRLNIAEIPYEDTNRNNRTLFDGCKKLGYQVATIKRNVKGCLKSGYCGMGCPVDAKQSMLVTYLPDAVAKGASVLSLCRVERLESKGGGKYALHGTLLQKDGRTPTEQTVTLEPEHVLLAGGAINTPGLLLRSGVNSDGLVGRRTYLHPTIAQFGLYPEPIQGFYGAPQSVASHHFAQRGGEVGFVLEAAPVHPMLAALATPGIGDSHWQMMQRLAYAAGHIALHIDGFHPDEPGGTVELRKSGAPVLDYELPERVWRAMRVASKEMARIQLATGALETRTPHDPPAVVHNEAELALIDRHPYGPNRLGVFSAHVMGGSAMNDDASRGVVRSDDLQMHALPGVHIIDGSVFPTSLGVNPQLSIYGLSHLISSRLAATWKHA
jgi:choline dehydrogenase-like flavoprotein